LIHVKKNRLPERILAAPEISHLTVITEPGHAARYADDVDVRLVDDVQNLELLRQATLEVLRTRRIDRIFSPFELGQSQAGFLRTHFGLPGTDFELAHAFSSKYALKQKMEAAGLPVAGYHLAYGLDQVREAGDHLGWPVVTKPMIGSASLNVCRFADAAEFLRFRAGTAAEPIAALKVPLVVESFVEMTSEYHCDAIVHDGRVLFASASRYLVPVLERTGIFGSYTLPADDPIRIRLLDLHERAVRAMGLTSGVTHMEFFETGDGLVAGEIACRPAGGGIPEAILQHSGVDLWRACLETALGQEPKIDAGAEDGVVAHCYLPISPGRIVTMTSRAELMTLPGVTKVEMLWAVGDVVPAPMYSASASALVFFRVDRPDQVMAVASRIYDSFRIEIEAVGG
jgi:biotin carboxylase